MIIFRYLARELFHVMAAVTAVLTVIVMSGRFVKYLAQAAAGDLPGDILFGIMYYRMPGFLEMVLPLAFFIAILLVYGRLYVESEMIILFSCGVTPNRIALYTLIPAFCVMLVVAYLSLQLTPFGAGKVQQIFDETDSGYSINTLLPGRFQKRAGQKQVSYMKELHDGGTRMGEIFIAESVERKGKEPQTIIIAARSGKVRIDKESGQKFLELYQGQRYEGAPGQLNYRVAHFEKYGQLIPDSSSNERRTLKVEAKSTRELFTSANLKDIAALQWRLSFPILVPVVTIIALVLSKTDPRKGRYVKMVPAVILYMIYLILLAAARSMVESGNMPPLIGMWWVHGVFLGLAWLLYYGKSVWLLIDRSLAGSNGKGKE